MYCKNVEALVEKLDPKLKKEISDFPLKYSGRYTRKNELTLAKLLKSNIPVARIAKLIDRGSAGIYSKFKRQGFATLTRTECNYFNVKMSVDNIWL